jgi:transcriptional regulator with XRE-family HTH domain
VHILWKAKQLRLDLAAKLGRDVTQEEVSQATGLAVSRISAIENNKTKGVEFDTLIRLAQFYELLSVAELIEFQNGEASGRVIVGSEDVEENYEAEVEGALDIAVPLPLECCPNITTVPHC